MVAERERAVEEKERVVARKDRDADAARRDNEKRSQVCFGFLYLEGVLVFCTWRGMFTALRDKDENAYVDFWTRNLLTGARREGEVG